MTKKSNLPSLNSSSKYNQNTKKWTVYIPNENVWYMLRLLEDKLFEFNKKYSHNTVTDTTFVFFMQIYMYEKILPTLRKAAQSNKNSLTINKTEAIALSKLDANCEVYLNKIT